MQQVARFDARHEDLLHDVVWDYYGSRLCTCSSDQHIKVWDKHPDSPTLLLNDTWKAHEASIVKVRWAHPEYGQVIASCSFDRSARIWEEQEHEPRQTGRRWSLKATLADARGVVQDLDFAPNHLGLLLATVAEDGIVRMYEAQEVTNLAHWVITQEFEATGGAKGTLTGGEAGTEGATASIASYCLTWCPSRFRPPVIAVGCGAKGMIRLFRFTQGRWTPRELISVPSVLHDISWAPNLGRSYQLIAGAGKDHRVRIWKLVDSVMPLVNPTEDKEEAWKDISYKHTEVANFVDHNAEVWRVNWNVTGTILASSGDDGMVRLFKATYGGQWKPLGVIMAEQARMSAGVKEVLHS